MIAILINNKNKVLRLEMKNNKKNDCEFIERPD